MSQSCGTSEPESGDGLGRIAGRTRSTPSPRWDALSKSERTAWSRAIGCSPRLRSARNTPRINPMAPPSGGSPGSSQSPPLGGTLLEQFPKGRCPSDGRFAVDLYRNVCYSYGCTLFYLGPQAPQRFAAAPSSELRAAGIPTGRRGQAARVERSIRLFGSRPPPPTSVSCRFRVSFDTITNLASLKGVRRRRARSGRRIATTSRLSRSPQRG